MSPSPPPGVRRVLRTEPRGAPDDARVQRQPRKLFYERLVRLSIRNSYYNDTGGVCSDFAIVPTGWTAALMQRLGLLFRPEEDGFSVLYDQLRAPQLLSYLRAQRDPATGGIWTRLSFLLSLTEKTFVNFTRIPIDTNPAERNFYLTNQQAHVAAEGIVLLTEGDRVTERERRPVTGGQLTVVASPDILRVRILALSGEEVACQPRCVPSNGRPRDTFTCADAVPPDAPGAVCTNRLTFDLSALPEGVYTVRAEYLDGDHRDRVYLYTALYPVPLCFVDLLFTRPEADAPGVYPVEGLEPGPDDGAEPRIVPVEYLLRFARRETWWSYVVVPQPPREELDGLSIRSAPGGGRAPLEFLGPCCVVLPGGGRGYRFLSPHPLPLEKRSPLHLQLVRRRKLRGGGHDEAVLMERMPVPSGQQVLPLTGEAAYARVAESLCRGPPGAACTRLLDLLRGDPKAGSGSPGDPPTRDFSDVYVYV